MPAVLIKVVKSFPFRIFKPGGTNKGGVTGATLLGTVTDCWVVRLVRLPAKNTLYVSNDGLSTVTMVCVAELK